MNIAVTGATGFLGRYVVNHLTAGGHRCRCWHRPDSDRTGFSHEASIQWVPGTLSDPDAADALLTGTDAVVHAALHRPGQRFRGGEGDLTEFMTLNLVGSVRLIELAKNLGVGRFVYISTCAVHEAILDDRKLDEAHPLWPTSHYGAHKAAVEKFVHSFGLGTDYPVCALRPTGIYGLAQPVNRSKWFELVAKVAAGQDVDTRRGGKEVHAADVAKAVEILLQSDGIKGQAYNCYDMYISEQQVAELARDISGSSSQIAPHNPTPKHQIDTTKLQALGMNFGGQPQLREYVAQLLTEIGVGKTG
ncbi:MAG: NAD-dependent epimerase/dehydratase family protein [Phycisphaerae bacterium]